MRLLLSMVVPGFNILANDDFLQASTSLSKTGGTANGTVSLTINWYAYLHTIDYRTWYNCYRNLSSV
jgi:hypothetical protein